MKEGPIRQSFDRLSAPQEVVSQYLPCISGLNKRGAGFATSQLPLLLELSGYLHCIRGQVSWSPLDYLIPNLDLRKSSDISNLSRISMLFYESAVSS